MNDRKKWFAGLYRDIFPMVAGFISRKGGSLQDAQDIFQEALLLFYEKSSGNEAIRSDRAYLIGISRNLWYRKCRQEPSCEEVDPELRDFEYSGRNEQPAVDKLIELLQQTGKRCMEILQAFYYDQLSMTDLAGRFGFTSQRSATVQKYKCLEKVREEIKQKQLSYEDFLA